MSECQLQGQVVRVSQSGRVSLKSVACSYPKSFGELVAKQKWNMDIVIVAFRLSLSALMQVAVRTLVTSVALMCVNFGVCLEMLAFSREVCIFAIFCQQNTELSSVIMKHCLFRCPAVSQLIPSTQHTTLYNTICSVIGILTPLNQDKQLACKLDFQESWNVPIYQC